MPRVGFEFSTTVFVRTKTVHALDRAAKHDKQCGKIINAEVQLLSKTDRGRICGWQTGTGAGFYKTIPDYSNQ
jgi:hypothetical protein